MPLESPVAGKRVSKLKIRLNGTFSLQLRPNGRDNSSCQFITMLILQPAIIRLVCGSNGGQL